MGFFEKLKKKSGNTDVKTVIVNAQYNPYYKGYNNFSYPIDSKNKISLRVLGRVDLGKIDLPEYSPLYECDIHYNDNYLDDELYGFDRLIIGLNLGRMVEDSEYTKFVFTRLLDRSRIKYMHDVEFGILEGKKNGNYVGSVLEAGDNLIELVNDNIGDIVELSSYTNALHDLYRRHAIDLNTEKRKRAEASNSNRQAKINELSALLKELTESEKEEKIMRK